MRILKGELWLSFFWLKIMNYIYHYKTPYSFSDMSMRSDGHSLTGLWFDGTAGAARHEGEYEDMMLPVFEDTIRWLDIYFGGGIPDFTPEYRIENLTEFREEVLKELLAIPYGKTTTYGDIARKIAGSRNIKRMSAQAVGNAVGWNPICIIIPCHRVIGSDGSLTGYAGGLNNKTELLSLEGN